MKYLSTIKGRFTLLLVSFFLLVIVSVGVMFWGVRTQESDAIIINLAGRQRMLSQKLTWLALNDPENLDFQVSVDLFEQTLKALRFGGLALDSSGTLINLPPAPDPELENKLDQVTQTWNEFQQYLLFSDLANLSVESPQILAQLDDVVTAFETRAESKNHRMAIIQSSFLLAAILLLSWGFFLTRQRIVKPLNILDTAVQKMTEGDLNWSMPSMEKDELGELAWAFENMKKELASSRSLLETRVARRTKELVSAFEFSQEIIAEREQSEIITSVVERARQLMNAESAALCIISPDSGELEMIANSGTTEVALGTRRSIDTELTLSVIEVGKTVAVKTGCVDCAFLDENPDGHCVVTPLRAMDRTIGALCVVRSEGKENNGDNEFDPYGQRAMALLVSSAAIAISNTRLAKLEHQKVEEEAALAEREEIAANLHDDLAQTLSFTRLKLEQLEDVLSENSLSDERTNINQIISAINTAYNQVRSVLTGLFIPASADEDFFRNLTAIVADFNQNCDCLAELKIINPSALEFSPEIQVQILHVVREALSNIQRHAEASNVLVSVERLDGLAVYSVQDDGIGFDLGLKVDSNHFGIQIMQTRVDRSGGEFQILSALNEGTKVKMTFPIKSREALVGDLQ